MKAQFLENFVLHQQPFPVADIAQLVFRLLFKTVSQQTLQMRWHGLPVRLFFNQRGRVC